MLSTPVWLAATCLLLLAALVAALTLTPTTAARHPAASGIDEPFFFSDLELTIVITHRHREAYAHYAVPELAAYLARTHTGTRIHLVAVQDKTELPFRRGLSNNVALAYLGRYLSPDHPVVFQDVDIVPRKNLSYQCPPRGSVHIWWINGGGMKGRLGDFLHAGGYSNLFSGWGGEETSFWARLELQGVQVQNWYQTERPRGAVVLDLDEKGQDYWHSGENTEDPHDVHIRFVNQEHPLYGVRGPKIENPPSTSWYEPTKALENERLKAYLDSLSPAEARALAQRDGASAIHLSSVQSDDFFSENGPWPRGVRVTNLTFNQDEALREPLASVYALHPPALTYLSNRQSQR